jgi:hypothetical protein
MDDRSVAQIAPSGAFFAQVDVNCDNPLLSVQQVQEFCGVGGLGPTDSTTLFVGRRNTEGGGRQDDIGHQAFRGVVGVRGEFGPDSAFQFDTFFQHGQTERSSTYLNDFSIVRLGRALQVRLDDRLDPDTGGPLDPATFGTPQCVALLEGTDPNCVPWNIFTPGGVSTESLQYLQTPGLIRADHTQRVANANITGDLTTWMKLPSATTGLGVNVGVEWREEETQFQPDLAFSTGDLAGQGGATLPTLGGYDVKEIFTEARLPVIEGRRGAEALTVEAGYRFSDYNLGFETDTYKTGLDWSPLGSLRFRASFQHAVRAPSVGELFSPATVLLDGTTDPCDGTAGDELNNGPDPGMTPEICARSGLDPALFGNVPRIPLPSTTASWAATRWCSRRNPTPSRSASSSSRTSCRDSSSRSITSISMYRRRSAISPAATPMRISTSASRRVIPCSAIASSATRSDPCGSSPRDSSSTPVRTSASSLSPAGTCRRTTRSPSAATVSPSTSSEL